MTRKWSAIYSRATNLQKREASVAKEDELAEPKQIDESQKKPDSDDPKLAHWSQRNNENDKVEKR
jgi:hypothetical protein